MSYEESPELNPYAAPASKIEVAEFGQPSGYVGYSGFWRRVAAYLIDYVIMFVVQIALSAIVGLVIVSTKNQNSQAILIGVNYIVVIILSVAYYAGMESSSSQATLGKMALGVKVTDLYGRRISFWRAVGRLFAKGISIIILGIGLIMVAFTEKKQGLHDMMAGTLVLKTR